MAMNREKSSGSRGRNSGRGGRERMGDRDMQVRRIIRTKEDIEGVDSAKSESFEKFITHQGKILACRITGVSSKQQRRIKRLAKHARSLGTI